MKAPYFPIIGGSAPPGAPLEAHHGFGCVPAQVGVCAGALLAAPLFCRGRAPPRRWLSPALSAKNRPMLTVILVIHLMLAAALTGVILVQKSEGGALGMGGGGGMSGFMTGRSAANLLTRTTAIIAACFFATSIALALISSHQRAPSSLMNSGAPAAPSGPLAPTPSTAPQLPATNPPAGTAPATPSSPAAPLAK